MKQQWNKFAVASVLIWLAGVLIGYVMPAAYLLGTLSLPLAIIGLRQIRKTNEKGKLLAVVGAFLGGLYIFVFLVGFLTYFMAR